MTRYVLSLMFFASAISSVSANAQLHLIDLNKHPHARCLDSTAAGFYFRQASAVENATKWVFSLEGGGECVTQESCDERKFSDLGSSKGYKNTTALRQLQSESESDNPDFCTWNQVFVKYCSGDLHMGQQTQPGQSLENIQFSGHFVLEGVLGTLLDEKFGLENAELVVWSGNSAGGLGATDSVDYAMDSLKSYSKFQGKVFGVPIGGFYYSNQWPYTGTTPKPTSYIPWTYDAIKDYHQLWNAFVPTRCAVGPLSDTPWECMFANASYATIESPIFFVEAQTDEVVMPLHNGLPALWDNNPPECRNNISGCPEAILHYMDTWRQHMEDSLQQVIVQDKAGRNAKDGLFNPACLIHTTFSTYRPKIDGLHYLEAVGDWVFNRTRHSKTLARPHARPHVYFDSCGVMCNPSC